MIQQSSHKGVSILHELDLGQHILLIMSDSSIDLLANDEQTSSLADNAMRLDCDETYKLFISLHEQFIHRKDSESNTDEIWTHVARQGKNELTLL